MTMVLDELIPTPSGAYLLSDIRTELSYLMDLSDSARYTTARINAAINKAIRDSWHDLAKVDYYEWTTTLDQKDYQLPTDYIGMKAVTLEGLSSSVFSPDWPLTTSYAATNNPTPIKSDDFTLVEDGGTKYFRFLNDSIPASLTLRMEYYARWSPLTTELETTDIPLAYLIPATMANLYTSWELMNPRYDVDDIRTRIALCKDESDNAKKEYKVSLAPNFVSRRRIGVGE